MLAAAAGPVVAGTAVSVAAGRVAVGASGDCVGGAVRLGAPVVAGASVDAAVATTVVALAPGAGGVPLGAAGSAPEQAASSPATAIDKLIWLKVFMIRRFTVPSHVWLVFGWATLGGCPVPVGLSVKPWARGAD